MIAQPLRMVPRRRRDHALVALFFRKQKDCVQRAALLLGCRKLQVFELQVNICARQLRQSLAVQGRRCHDGIANTVMGGADMVQGQ